MMYHLGGGGGERGDHHISLIQQLETDRDNVSHNQHYDLEISVCGLNLLTHDKIQQNTDLYQRHTQHRLLV